MIKFLRIALLLATSAGNAQDMTAGLNAYESGNYVVAARELTPHAMDGDPTASDIIGYLNYTGEGMEQDYNAAAFWFLQSVRNRTDQGHTLLGMMYYRGQGVEQDFTMAVRYLKLPAQAGDESAKFVMRTLCSNYIENQISRMDCNLTPQPLSVFE